MTPARLRHFYVVGIALNAIAFTAAAIEGQLAFAVTFAFVMGYLGLRYAMVVRS